MSFTASPPKKSKSWQEQRSEHRQAHGITNDPNRPDDPEYIVRLPGQVITVSLETVKVVKGLQRLPVRLASSGNQTKHGR